MELMKLPGTKEILKDFYLTNSERVLNVGDILVMEGDLYKKTVNIYFMTREDSPGIDASFVENNPDIFGPVFMRKGTVLR